jgi:hypothetical protein
VNLLLRDKKNLGQSYPFYATLLEFVFLISKNRMISDD